MTTLRQRTLGDILAEERLIARSQLEQAQRAANRSGAPLVVVLLEQGLVAEEALVDALCKHLDVEVFEANPGGRAFYTAYGFEPVGRRIHQATGQPLLRLRLAS